jgi:UDP-2-acetamido-2-deoxy-ribo-hexuluronate aminotransferase
MNITLPIQMYDPKREYANHKEEIDKSIQTVLNHGIFINGPEIKELENKLNEFIGVKHSICVSNGTDALKIALLALDVKPNDEVITVSHSWISTAEVISLINAIPVFIDIEPDTFNMDPSKLEEAITPKTKAIIMVSLYGQVGLIDKVNNIAAKYNIPVIEDGAQSFGAIHNGKKSCNLTLLSTSSFFPSKPLGCYGDGGACFTNDIKLADKMRAIRAHGGVKRFHHDYVGMNARLDTLQASILLAKFKYFDNTLEMRNKCAKYYLDNLKDIPNITLPKVINESNDYNINISAWAQFSILAENKDVRDKVVEFMINNGVNLAIFYPTPLHTQKCFQGISRHHILTTTEDVCDRVFNLPCYGEITYEEMDYIVNLLRTFYNV